MAFGHFGIEAQRHDSIYRCLRDKTRARNDAGLQCCCPAFLLNLLLNRAILVKIVIVHLCKVRTMEWGHPNYTLLDQVVSCCSHYKHLGEMHCLPRCPSCFHNIYLPEEIIRRHDVWNKCLNAFHIRLAHDQLFHDVVLSCRVSIIGITGYSTFSIEPN